MARGGAGTQAGGVWTVRCPFFPFLLSACLCTHRSHTFSGGGSDKGGTGHPAVPVDGVHRHHRHMAIGFASCAGPVVRVCEGFAGQFRWGKALNIAGNGSANRAGNVASVPDKCADQVGGGGGGPN